MERLADAVGEAEHGGHHLAAQRRLRRRARRSARAAPGGRLRRASAAPRCASSFDNDVAVRRAAAGAAPATTGASASIPARRRACSITACSCRSSSCAPRQPREPLRRARLRRAPRRWAGWCAAAPTSWGATCCSWPPATCRTACRRRAPARLRPARHDVRRRRSSSCSRVGDFAGLSRARPAPRQRGGGVRPAPLHRPGRLPGRRRARQPECSATKDPSAWATWWPASAAAPTAAASRAQATRTVERGGPGRLRAPLRRGRSSRGLPGPAGARSTRSTAGARPASARSRSTASCAAASAP